MTESLLIVVRKHNGENVRGTDVERVRETDRDRDRLFMCYTVATIVCNELNERTGPRVRRHHKSSAARPIIKYPQLVKLVAASTPRVLIYSNSLYFLLDLN